jgi:hypothetical protein
VRSRALAKHGKEFTDLGDRVHDSGIGGDGPLLSLGGVLKIDDVDHDL